jgi:hypothetical protein
MVHPDDGPVASSSRIYQSLDRLPATQNRIITYIREMAQLGRDAPPGRLSRD